PRAGGREPRRGVAMRPPRSSRPFARAALLALALLLPGCAGQPRPHTDPAPIVPVAPAEGAPASPAARDALDAGLRWIAADAAGTEVGQQRETPPPKGGTP